MEKKFGKQMQQGKNKKQQMGKNSAKQQSQNQNQKKKAAWKMPDLDFGKQSERAQRFGDGAALGAVQLDSNRQVRFSRIQYIYHLLLDRISLKQIQQCASRSLIEYTTHLDPSPCNMTPDNVS